MWKGYEGKYLKGLINVKIFTGAFHKTQSSQRPIFYNFYYHVN